MKKSIVLLIIIAIYGCKEEPINPEILTTWSQFCEIYSDTTEFNKDDIYSKVKKLYSESYRTNVSKLMDLALNGSETQIKKLSLAEQIQVLRIRKGYSNNILRNNMVDSILYDRQMASYLVFNNCPSLSEFKILSDLKVKAQYKLPKGYVFFDLEGESWKINLTPNYEFSNKQLLEIQKQHGLNRQAIIRQNLSLKENEKIPWDPKSDE